MTKKGEKNFFIFAIILLILFFGVGSGFIGDIFGEEFESEVAINDSWALFLPSHLDARFPGTKIEIKHFNSTYTGSRSFLSKENINFNISGTQGSAFNSPNNPGLRVAPFTPESGSGSIIINGLMTRLYTLGLFIPPRSSTDVLGETLFRNAQGFWVVNQEKYCNSAYGGAQMNMGCASTNGAWNDFEFTDRIWGYFTIVNGEPVYWNESLSKWFRNTQDHSFSPLPFSNKFVVPVSSLKDYYNEIELVFMFDGIVTKTLTKFEIYIEPDACTDSQNYVTRVTSIGGGNVISLSQDGSVMTLPTPDGEFQEIDNPFFCHTRPVIRETSTGAIQDFFPYDSLIEGGTITVPAGETWVFFWRSLPSSTTITLCEDGNIFNKELNKCVITPSVEYICTDGVFDEKRLACLVQANSEKFCSDPSAIYIQEDDICRKIMDTELDFCSGKIIEEAGRIICLIEPELKIECSKGVYNEIIDKCVVFPDVQDYQGEIGKIGIIIAFLIASFLIYTNRSKVRKWFK